MRELKKVSFLHLPTPLEYLPRLSEKLGIELWIKRDDLTGLGMGGNKLRKLEYLLYDAKQQGADRLLTVGGAQTNHGRLTAAVAAKYGLKCTIACIDDYPGEVSANLLLDRIMGAQVVIKKDDGRPEAEQYDELLQKLSQRYEADGEKVYCIPMGGSNLVGMCGYRECAQEIDAQAKQLGLEKARLVCAVGSIGTYIGLYCGLQEADSGLNLTGIAISPFEEEKEKRICQYYAEVCDELELEQREQPNFQIEKGYTRGGYNNPCKQIREAIYEVARQEAILLDPCYTGKAFAGMQEMIAEGKIAKGEAVIFLHTGGAPGLNTPVHRKAFEQELRSGIEVLGKEYELIEE